MVRNDLNDQSTVVKTMHQALTFTSLAEANLTKCLSIQFTEKYQQLTIHHQDSN